MVGSAESCRSRAMAVSGLSAPAQTSLYSFRLRGQRVSVHAWLSAGCINTAAGHIRASCVNSIMQIPHAVLPYPVASSNLQRMAQTPATCCPAAI